MIEIDNNLFQSLNADTSVKLFREILYAMATSNGIPLTNINCPLTTNVGDGGVDASFNVPNGDFKFHGLAHGGYNSYQLKTINNYKPWQPAIIKKELCNKEGLLGNSIKHCLDRNGTYFLVCFKQDFQDNQLNETKYNIETCFKEAGYADPKVEVIGISQLSLILKQFNHLVLILNLPSLNGIQNFDNLNNSNLYNHKYYADTKREQIIVEIRSKLLDSTSSLHIRILGDSGIGKTKLLLEAINIDGLKNQMLYIEYKDWQNSAVPSYIRANKGSNFILIVDECSYDNAYKLWSEIKNNCKVRLVTLFNELEKDLIDCVDYYNLSSLDDKQIEEILKNEYWLEEHQANRIASLCYGFPHLAHIVGNNLKNHQQDIYNGLNNIWHEFVANTEDVKSIETKERLFILKQLSAFSKFGIAGNFKKEIDFIFNHITKIEPSFSSNKFYEIITYLRDRKILQGTSTLTIRPKIFHMWLYNEWLDSIRNNFGYDGFIKDMPSELLKYFHHMFRNINVNQKNEDIIAKILNSNSLSATKNYQDYNLLFAYLVEKFPRLIFDKIKLLVSSLANKSDFKAFEFLRYIIIDKDLFTDGMDIIFDNFTNSKAIVIFSEAFRPWLSETNATLGDRYLYLKTLITKDVSSCQIAILLKSIDYAFMVGGHSVVKDDPFGRNLISYEPSNVEWIDYVANMQQLYFSLIDKHSIYDGLLGYTFSFINATNIYFNDVILNFLDKIKQLDLFSDINAIYDFMISLQMLKEHSTWVSEEVEEKLTELKKELLTSDNRLKLVLMSNEYTYKDLNLDDKQVVIGEDIWDTLSYYNEITKIAINLIGDDNFLDTNHDLIFSSNNKSLLLLGQEIAKLDKKHKHLDTIIAKYEDVVNHTFIGFLRDYLLHIYKQKEKLYMATLENFTKDDIKLSLLPKLAFRDSYKATKLLFQFIKLDRLKYMDVIDEHYRVCFLDLLEDMLVYLIEINTLESIITAFNLVSMNQDKYDNNRINSGLVLDILEKYTFMATKIDGYKYVRIAIEYITINSIKEVVLNIFYLLIARNNLGNRYLLKAIAHIADLYPTDTWQIIISNLVDDNGNKGKFYWRLQPFLKKFCILDYYPSKMVFQYIDEDVEVRLPLILHLTYDDLSDSDDFSYFRELIIRYGGLKVYDIFNQGGRITTGVHMMGKEEASVSKRLNLLQEAFAKESNIEVKKYLQCKLNEIKLEVKNAIARDEREIF